MFKFNVHFNFFYMFVILRLKYENDNMSFSQIFDNSKKNVINSLSVYDG